MSNTIFTKVDYTVESLIKDVEKGEISLPDIQRPFVWNNKKIRDLLDSMYKGYPVGYLLFWKNESGDRQIGVEEKQKSPKLLIVDGQQRLTSLYAIIKGKEIVKENYDMARIYIAFNPIEERFEVTDAAIRKDNRYIPDISEIWNSDSSVYNFVRSYISNLETFYNINEEERNKIETAIPNLHNLIKFPFVALELDADIAVEDVSDIFVRINSKGTTLNQSDFILTLMSVFWDEGRKELEQFCSSARTPSKKSISPYNHFIEPDPSQLLRVNTCVGFKRARLRHVYSILRGKDLDSGEFSDEKRNEQFEILKRAQEQTLHIQHWHDYFKCLKLAGYSSKKLVSSNNTLLYTYALYLIGKIKYKIEEKKLQGAISQWYFMSSITGRYTASPETIMESDLAKLRNVTTADQFLNYLSSECEITLTQDFWNITLPNNLATSSHRSPSLFAYAASLTLLNAPALFSELKISALMDPSLTLTRSSIERHLLFPKSYLESIDITQTRDINQIANYAYVEHNDNSDMSKLSPLEYVPKYKERFTQNDLRSMYHFHALPENWESMEYIPFLENRRKLIASVIQEGYHTLQGNYTSTSEKVTLNLQTILDEGESDAVEFKSTLRKNLATAKNDKTIQTAALKTIAGFLNTNGGTLIIGVADDSTPVGIEEDGFPSEDNMYLYLTHIVNSHLSEKAMLGIHAYFDNYNEYRVMIVECDKSPWPIYAKINNDEKLYVRTGPSTIELPASQISDYIKARFR